MPALIFIILCFVAVFAIAYYAPGLAIVIGIIGLILVFRSMIKDANKRKE